jgi:hypothetical protein
VSTPLGVTSPNAYIGSTKDSKRFWRASLVSRARIQMREQAQATLVDIVDRPIKTKAVSQSLDKLERGLGYWLAFVTEPAVAPMNNAAENALCKLILLRKIIGTNRTESG